MRKSLKNQKPKTNNKQPTTKNQQQKTNNQQPTTNNKQPTTNNKQPISNLHLATQIPSFLGKAEVFAVVYRTVYNCGHILSEGFFEGGN